ncbi:MAG TPA: DUF2892 domain-containing protein [Aquaticitalea sp.]|nr:DUF2892 domain-containing protein [Aquaticitalea sp.]HNU58754.1 DUF2892 domain-containing protein [Aquaticitalea sp.]
MKVRIAHAFAGILILTGLLLGVYVNQNWLWLAAIPGINLLQNSMTNWCLLYVILDKLGIKDKEENCSK